MQDDLNLIMKAMQENLQYEKNKKLENYRRLNRLAKKGAVLFTGSSLMEQFPICELLQSHGIEHTVYNRGIGGFTTAEFLEHMDTMLLDLAPSAVFLNIGTNDLNQSSDANDGWMETLLHNYSEILRRCREQLPDTSLSIMAFYPMNEALPGAPEHLAHLFCARSNQKILQINEKLQDLASAHGCRYLDVNQGLTNADGQLKPEYTVDGVHLYSSAYEVVFRNLLPYLCG